LNAIAEANTAKREKGATKKKKDQTHHTNNNKNSPVSNHNHKKNNTCETCDPTNPGLSYIFSNTPQRKRPWPQRVTTESEREYTY
jgi:hypothetical protein